MLRTLSSAGLLGCLLLTAGSASAQKKRPSAQPARTVSFDQSWRFSRDSVAGGELPAYRDAQWRKLDLPHDWSIEDLPTQIPGRTFGPFDKKKTANMMAGFVTGGTGWYRKRFATDPGATGKRVSIQFDGVYMNADVWLNGHHLGTHPYGYTSFRYDLTPYLLPAGQENVLAVRVRNIGTTARWYSGSGIYRHVWLTTTEPVHVAPWGVYVTTPEATASQARVAVQTTLANEQPTPREIELVTTLRSPAGKKVGEATQKLTLAAGASQVASQALTLAKPALWSVETPSLYRAVTEIRDGGRVVDQVETPFGVRSIAVSAQQGFVLNGKRVLLKGGSIHHDNGPLGAVALDRAEERKVELLKQNGFNAVRFSHNPPSPAMLDACDRLGMLAIDEAFDVWETGKYPQDYHLYFKEWWQRDLEAVLLRDRNHPAVILWSIGNEIPERVDSDGLRIAGRLAAFTRRLDATRPVTEALCQFYEPANQGKDWSLTVPAFPLLDVGGYNYLWQRYAADHQQFPNRIMLGTESYAREALQNWNLVERNPYLLGDFVWTAVDYLGEISLGYSYYDTRKLKRGVIGWPWYTGWCGDLDLTGAKKPQSYYRDVVWRQRPLALMVHEPIPEGKVENIADWGWPQELPHWTWPAATGKPLQVRVFSRAPLVRLSLNGRVIGEKQLADTTITAVFEVPYQPGTLRAVNVVGGKETDAVELKTTGPATHLRLTADRPTITTSRDDLAYVTVEVLDANDQVVPNAEVPVKFSLQGGGELAGVISANPTDLASFQQPTRKTFRGRCQAIVRPLGPGGTITLQATAEGLAAGQVVVTAKKK
ncbi:glycoside hydrolase family 2 TIM barrel-domain containing protein [Hymenobacter monticola]|uniref:DUF4982 domain-containing protein n=1 Tax=Hymenobacter monticola TaxID=1705399 RepID=A0ABY4BB58_9BACT|nr:glycoside hydrolase family 2 TIM barrel-domain containing protein [Hymenobacter monticola]UOE36395.1 DUF4982 domain-containing protein [Hymenobacter monticola]